MRDDEEVFVEPYTYDGDDLEEVHIDNITLKPRSDETIQKNSKRIQRSLKITRTFETKRE
jgi:hypothetical protein